MVKELANSILPWIQMEEDIPSNHMDGKLPILDLHCWLDREDGVYKIHYDFYRKPMASRRPLKQRSAIPENQKRSILIEEALRRLRNVSPHFG